MQVALVIVSAGLLGLIVYFAVSPKSSRLLKLAALAALGLIAVSIGVCGVFLIKGPGEAEAAIQIPVFEEAAEPEKKSNGPAIIVFLAVFLLILGLITVLAMRSQKKAELAREKAGGVPVVSDDLKDPVRERPRLNSADAPPDGGGDNFDL